MSRYIMNNNTIVVLKTTHIGHWFDTHSSHYWIQNKENVPSVVDFMTGSIEDVYIKYEIDIYIMREDFEINLSNVVKVFNLINLDDEIQRIEKNTFSIRVIKEKDITEYLKNMI